MTEKRLLDAFILMAKEDRGIRTNDLATVLGGDFAVDEIARVQKYLDKDRDGFITWDELHM
jgi:Ca2+-binding EF-hand superfamily protein